MLLIIVFVISHLFATENKETKEKQIIFQRPQFNFNQWFFFISPFWGEVTNFNQIPIRVFQSTQNDNLKIHSGNKNFSGKGKGIGLEFMAIKENWQILYVHFSFPMYPNSDQIQILDYWQQVQTKVTGNVFLMKYTFYKNNQIQPFIGFSHFQGSGPHDYSIVNNFSLYSVSTQNWIHFPKVDVKVYVEDPNPQLGVSFKLPIQNWKFDTTYSYGFERVNTDLKTTIGEIKNNFEDLSFGLYDFSDPTKWILPLNLTIRKKYFSHRLGVSIFMDYRRFISLKITLRRDLTFARWVSNTVISLILSKNFGFNVFYEFSERSVGTIRYWLIGPTFVFQL